MNLWFESVGIPVQALLDGLLPRRLVLEVVVAVGAAAVEAELAAGEAFAVPIESQKDFIQIYQLTAATWKIKILLDIFQSLKAIKGW